VRKWVGEALAVARSISYVYRTTIPLNVNPLESIFHFRTFTQRLRLVPAMHLHNPAKWGTMFMQRQSVAEVIVLCQSMSISVTLVGLPLSENKVSMKRHWSTAPSVMDMFAVSYNPLGLCSKAQVSM
jgi:hypothetical protein